MILLKIKIFHNNSNWLVGKTFSFTPDEANVDDLAKACEFSTKFILFSENIDLVSYIEVQTGWKISVLQKISPCKTNTPTLWGVSQKTWTIHVTSRVFPCVTNKWPFQDQAMSKTIVWTSWSMNPISWEIRTMNMQSIVFPSGTDKQPF